MEIIDQELSAIILKSLYFTLTPEEEQKLQVFLDASDANRLKFQELTNPATLEEMLSRFEKRNANQAANLERIRHLLREPSADTITRSVKTMRRKWLWAAAVIVIAGSAILLIKRSQVTPDAKMAQQVVPKRILPGTEGAILTLADGKELVLDSMKNGWIASQKGARIELADGLLTYIPAESSDGLQTFNTVTAPRGRFFRILLPDGSKVWLNAASSIQFPTAFAGKERRVKISGEVYMEIAQVVAQPFIAEVNNQAVIDVIGTRFNVHAYVDEMPSITLVDGALKVRLPAGVVGAGSVKEVILGAGQEVTVKKHLKTVELKTGKADLEKILSWRRGFFNFENQGIREVMQSLARWYDLDIVYEGNIPPVIFQGELDRSMSLNDILQILEDSKIHFTLEGRRITVRP